jgi:hypothetical protein
MMRRRPVRPCVPITIRSASISSAKATICSAGCPLVEGRHPLAAALALRAAIEHALRGPTIGLASEVERWVLEAASLEPQIADHQGFGDHAAFVERMARRR